MTLQSNFSERISQYLDWREAIGYSRDTDGRALSMFDRYCAANHPEAKELTREIVCGWIDSQTAGIANKITAIRNFSKYLEAHGFAAYT